MRDPRFDEYIEKAAPFARPILRKIRDLFHRACPEIEERIKWRHLSFEKDGIVAGAAAFKNHVNFGFWKHAEMPDPRGLFVGDGPLGMGKLSDVSELPPDDVLIEYMKVAVKLQEIGAASPAKKKAAKKKAAKKKAAKPSAEPPEDLLAALRKKKGALAKFEAFPPSHRREYVEWIVEAKRDETRSSRIETAVEWIAEGKPRNWKYMKPPAKKKAKKA